ncbi:hypothetical protein COE15_09365 [Bacillus cereus]|nr:hypothetical protein CN288_09015 [Bacillus sp. AFS023182]PGY01757.1 hypothetical protein COE15_09365 [Bacillus cereus]
MNLQNFVYSDKRNFKNLSNTKDINDKGQYSWKKFFRYAVLYTKSEFKFFYSGRMKDLTRLLNVLG